MGIKNNNPERSKTSFFILIGMSTAILLAAPVLLLMLLGFLLDHWLHTGNLFKIGGAIVGFISGMINMYRLLTVMQKRKK